MIAAGDPASRLHAENIQVNGIAFRWNDAIHADHAVLLTSGHNLAGQKQQRTLRVVYQHQPVYLGTIALRRRRNALPHEAAYISVLGDHYLSRTQPLVQRKKLAGSVGFGSDYRKHRQASVL